MQKSFVPLPAPPPSVRSKRRHSPPSKESKDSNHNISDRTLSETRDNISIRSQRSERSARSTICGRLSIDHNDNDIDLDLDRKALDYSSSSSSSSSPIYPLNRVTVNPQSNVKRGVYSQSNVESQSYPQSQSKGTVDWNALNEEESKSSSITPPNQIQNINKISNQSRSRYIPPNQRYQSSSKLSTNQRLQTQAHKIPNKISPPPPNLERKIQSKHQLQHRSTPPRTPINCKENKAPNNGMKSNKLSLQNPEEKSMEDDADWDHDISRSVRSNNSNNSSSTESGNTVNTAFMEASVLNAINHIIDEPKPPRNGLIAGKAPIIHKSRTNQQKIEPDLDLDSWCIYTLSI